MLYNLLEIKGMRPEDFAAYTRAQLLTEAQNPTRIGERIVPTRIVRTHKLDAGNIRFRPVAASVVAPNAMFPEGPLGTWSKREYEILKQAMKYSLSETDILKFMQLFGPQGINVPSTGTLGLEASELLQEPYRLLDAVITGILDLREIQRWDCLALDAHEIPSPDGVNSIVVTWNIPNSQKYVLAGGDMWTDYTNADGLADLETMSLDNVTAYGVPINTYYMSTLAFQHLTNQAKVQAKLAAMGMLGLGFQLNTALVGATDVAGNVAINAIQRYLSARRDNANPPTIILYDKTYNKFDFYGNAQPADTRYLPVNYVVGVGATPLQGPILPNPRAGTAVGYYADGPVIENQGRSGLHTWGKMVDEPYHVEVKGAAWGLPIIDERTPRSLKAWT